MKPLFYLLTAAAHPFGLYVVVPMYMEHCYVVTGSDGAGRAMAAGFAELFAIALWTLGVVIVSLLVSRLHYGMAPDHRHQHDHHPDLSPLAARALADLKRPGLQRNRQYHSRRTE
ncbi:MAG: hypothetical protein ACLT2T_11670 [Bilophila wadsworthia]